MSRTRTCSSMLLVFVFLTPIFVFAQGNGDAAEQARQAQMAAIAAAAQQQAADQKAKEDMEKSQAALRDFLNSSSTQRRPSPGDSAALDARFLEFRQAIPKFRAATDDFRWTLSLERKLDKSLKSIETQTEVMLRYLNAAKVNHPRPDGSEFKDYSQSELAWETLNSAERIGAFLDLAVAAERQDVVGTKTLEFLFTLDGELLRLKWLTTHTKG